MSMYGTTDEPVTEGLTYAVVLGRAPRAAVLEALRGLRFSGWVGPQEGPWVAAVPDAPLGHVAARRRRVDDLGAALSGTTGAAAVTVLVRRDELLRLWVHEDGSERARYVSDLSVAHPDDDDAYPGPEGVDDAPVVASVSQRPDAAEELADALAEELGESEHESERLMRVARLLGWPEWLVAVDSLPRRVPGGPDADAFTRLRVGAQGVVGRVRAAAANVVRRSA